MAAVYSQAYVVLAATGAARDSEGLFFPRTPPTYEVFSHARQGVTGTVHAFPIPKDRRAASLGGYSQLDKEPLSSRGWVLQERLLASRSLHFASDQIFFECYAHCRSEDGYKMSGRHNSIHEEPGGSDRNPTQWSYRGPSIWYDIVRDYTRRELTKGSDKLPALSGLARIVEGQTGDTYVAGLWRSTLLEGILWQALGKHRGATNAPSEYRAPSWTWASIDCLAANLGLGECIERNTADTQRISQWVDIGTVLDCHIELKGENPYGEVTSGWIKIKAPVEPLTPSEEKEPDHDTVPHQRALRLKTQSGKPFGAYCMLDTLSDDMARELSLFALHLVYIDREAGGRMKSGRTVQALIITPVEGQQGCYRRVGKIIFDDRSLGECGWLEDRTLMETVTLL